MSVNYTDYKSHLVKISVVISIFIGFITAMLKLAEIITFCTVFLWITFGIAVVTFATLVWIAAFADCDTRHCLNNVLRPLVTGIFGTMLTSVVLLAVTFTETSVAGAIITGLLTAFLTLILTTATCFVKCVADSK